jgi:hypothetical protein
MLVRQLPLLFNCSILKQVLQWGADHAVFTYSGGLYKKRKQVTQEVKLPLYNS